MGVAVTGDGHIEEEKRKIRVGFLLPDDYKVVERVGDPEKRENTIYVLLRNHGGDIGATACSHHPFVYGNEKVRKQERGYSVSNKTTSRREGLPITNIEHDLFITHLERENNGSVIHYEKHDGLKILETLQDIKGNIGTLDKL